MIKPASLHRDQAKRSHVNIKLVQILVLITGFLCGCNRFHTDDTLLQIGSYKLTVADYEFARNSARYKSLTNEQLQDKLIEAGRVLACALDNKYDTIELLNRQLDYAMRYYASKVDGYVWNKTVKPALKVTEDDIREAYTMRSNEYHLELIHFPNEGLLKKYYTTDRPVQSVSDFYSAKEKTASDPDVKFYSVSDHYPFYLLGVYSDAVVLANAGDVLGPFETLYGYYMVHVADKRTIQPRPYEQEKPIINETLLNGLKEKYIRESQRRIFLETRPQMHDDAIAEIASKVNARERQWPGVDRNMVLMEYDFGGAHRVYTAANFIEFVHCQPMFSGSLSDPGDVKKMLDSWLIGICLFAKAQQMNMENDSACQLFRKMYQQDIFLHHYKQQNIYPEISIREEEMESYYREHQNDFTCFESAAVSIYKYQDIQSAFEGRKLVMDQSVNAEALNKKSNMDRKVQPLPKAKMIAVQVKDTVYSKEIIDAISRLRTGELSMPIEDNGSYRVIYLSSKSGSVTMPYKYARENIRSMLFSKKENGLMAALGTKYPIKINRVKEYVESSKR